MTEKTHKNQKKMFQDLLVFISKKNSQIIYKNCIILTKRKANNNLKQAFLIWMKKNYQSVKV